MQQYPETTEFCIDVLNSNMVSGDLSSLSAFAWNLL